MILPFLVDDPATTERLILIWVYLMRVVVEQLPGHANHAARGFGFGEILDRPCRGAALRDHLDHNAFEGALVRIVREGDMEVVIRTAGEIAIDRLARVGMGLAHEEAIHLNQVALGYRLAAAYLKVLQFSAGTGIQ